MYVITEDPPPSELSQEEEVTDRATGHGNDDNEGSQEELPTQQHRKRGSVSRSSPHKMYCMATKQRRSWAWPVW